MRKYPAAYNFLAWAEAERGHLEEAQAALKKYVDLAPTEANAYDSLAHMALRRGATDEAIAQAKKALQVDPSFVVAHAVLGDALLFAGKGKEARRSYAALIATDDPQIHHDGAMREARSWLFDGRFGDGERALSTEADLSAKTKRPGDQADALVEMARVQLDRGALAEAGQSLRQARAALDAPEAAAILTEGERRRLVVGGDPRARHGARRRSASASWRRRAPTRWAWCSSSAATRARARSRPRSRAGSRRATATTRSALGDARRRRRGRRCGWPTRWRWCAPATRARARAIFDELSRRMVNDLEGALTRPRAAAWLKGHAEAQATNQ